MSFYRTNAINLGLCQNLLNWPSMTHALHFSILFWYIRLIRVLIHNNLRKMLMWYGLNKCLYTLLYMCIDIFFPQIALVIVFSKNRRQANLIIWMSIICPRGYMCLSGNNKKRARQHIFSDCIGISRMNIYHLNLSFWWLSSLSAK